MATFIIADLHLSESRPILTNAFANFYDRNLILNDKLIIIGDMFDIFVGIDKNSRFQKKIREIILKAQRRGVITMFMHGNRDFLMDEESAAYFGMKLISDFYILPTVNGQALLAHGDQLCMRDKSFRLFRLISKNRFVHALFMAMPLSWRKSIGKKIRNSSKNKEPQRATENYLEDATFKSAGATFLLRARCQILIHGHFHVFGGENDAFDEGLHRLGLGMWSSHYSYIKVDRNEIKLVQRSMEKNF